MKKKISFLCKLLFSAGACAFIFTRLDYRHFSESFLTARIPVLALALLLAFLVQVLCSWRMHLLLPGVPIRFRYVLFTNFAAAFLRLTVPSDIGAELGRGYYFSKKTGSPTIAFSAIILDRYCGLFSQFVVMSATALAFGLLRHQELWIKVGGASAAVALAFAAVLLVFLRFRPASAPPRKGTGRLRSVIATFSGYVHAFRNDPLRLAGAAGLSILAQSCNLMILMAASSAYGTHLAVHEASVTLFWATIGFFLPVSVAGLGVVEGIYATMFKLFLLQKETGVVVSLTLRVIALIIAIPGVLFFIYGEKMLKAPDKAEKKEEPRGHRASE